MSSDVHGPIDTVIVQFPPDATGVASAGALVELVDSGTIRLYDAMVVQKSGGTCEELDPQEGEGPLAALSALAGARSGLLGGDDLEELSGILDDGACAVALVYENAWAVPFVAAARSEGAELVASTRLTAQAIMDALDSLEEAG